MTYDFAVEFELLWKKKQKSYMYVFLVIKQIYNYFYQTIYFNYIKIWFSLYNIESINENNYNMYVHTSLLFHYNVGLCRYKLTTYADNVI